MSEYASHSERNKQFSRAQTIGWYVMTSIGVGSAYWVISKEHSVKDPVVGLVFICVTVSIAYFTRKFIRDNSDETGRLRLIRKQ
jgi:hypothetical protein